MKSALSVARRGVPSFIHRAACHHLPIFPAHSEPDVTQLVGKQHISVLRPALPQRTLGGCNRCSTMSEDRAGSIHDGQGELNLRLSAKDFSGLGPDAQRLLRQLAGSQQEQPQRHSMAPSNIGLPARIPPSHDQHMIRRPVSFEPAAGPPGYNRYHRTLPSSWQHHTAVQQPTEMDLDDFGEFYCLRFNVKPLQEIEYSGLTYL